MKLGLLGWLGGGWLLLVACGGKTLTGGGPADGGPPSDDAPTTMEAGSDDASGDVSMQDVETPVPPDAFLDEGSSIFDTDGSDGSGDGAVEADASLGEGGLTCGAASAGLGFSAACASCIAKHCCSDAETCAHDGSCVAVVKCELACIAGGGEPVDCASRCIEDAGSPSGAMETQSLDLCLQGSCSMTCL